MNKLPLHRRVQVISALIEGNSLRSTVRMTGVAMNTILKLLAEVGFAGGEYQNRVMRNLSCQRLQVDEVWCFCAAKEKNVPVQRMNEEGIGDVWTWTAIDAETKVVPCWLVGDRDIWHAREFIGDLASRLNSRIQLTADGLKVYVQAVRETFGQDIDFAQLIKVYGSAPGPDTKYSPAVCIDCHVNKISGTPDEDHISTSFVERQNLTMRMSMRRFTRLTNAFSKKIMNLRHSVAMHFLHYNFARKHQTLKTTPAIAAGVANRPWTLEDMVRLADSVRPASATG